MNDDSTAASKTRGDWLRYPRLYWSFARYCLIREIGFRVNFLTRCLASAMWVVLNLMFFLLVFRQTEHIGRWDPDQYLFFLGTTFVLNGLLNALFLQNCTELSTLIRTGNLDFALLKPIDEQFLLSCQRIDWAMVPNILIGVGMLATAAVRTGTQVTFASVLGYVLLLLAGLAILYSLMLSMAASSVWMISNRGLYELWFYVTQFARYPAEIYGGSVAGTCLNFLLLFVFPILLAINVPARFGMQILDSWALDAYLLLAAAVALFVSRRFFRFALTCYRSASS